MSALDHELQMRAFLRRCDAPSTALAYERELRRFATWLDARALHEETLLDYRDALRARGLRAVTVRWGITVVRAYLQWCASHGDAIAESAAEVSLPRRVRSATPRVLTASELRRLVQAPDRRGWQGRRDAIALICMGHAALRAGEVCRLRACDVELTRETCVLLVRGKGGHERRVALFGLPAKLMRNWHRQRSASGSSQGPLLPRVRGTQQNLDPDAMRYIVGKHAARAGLEGVHPHGLRHTAASLAIEAGEPLHRLRDRLGHSNLLTTSRYLTVIADR